MGGNKFACSYIFLDCRRCTRLNRLYWYLFCFGFSGAVQNITKVTKGRMGFGTDGDKRCDRGRVFKGFS